MDLNNLKPVKADEGSLMDVVHPETEEVIEGMSILLLGQDSSVFRKIQLAKQQAAINRMAKGKKALDLNAEKLAEETIDDLVKMTLDWEGFELDGKELKPTPENVRKIYTEWPWIREQAQEFVNNRANFFR